MIAVERDKGSGGVFVFRTNTLTYRGQCTTVVQKYLPHQRIAKFQASLRYLRRLARIFAVRIRKVLMKIKAQTKI